MSDNYYLENDPPLVSIITPTYNSERFIEETIKSVINQTYEYWEMIIVDDCSFDNTLNIIKKYVDIDHRIKFFRNSKNEGASKSRNVAIAKAKGSYIAFLDSDDLWAITKLEFQINFMLKNDIAFSFTKYKIINEKGVFIKNSKIIPSSLNYNSLLKNNVIGCLTVIININKTGSISMSNIKLHEDFILWLSILKNGHTAYGIQEDLGFYRIVRGSISRNKLKGAYHLWKIYRGIEKLSIIYSLWCIISFSWNRLKKVN